MSELANTIKQICDEKNLSLEAVVGTIESALAAAYRKDFGEKNQNIKVEFDIETAKSKVFDIKTVVEDVPEEELSDEEEKTSKDENIKDEAPRENKIENRKPSDLAGRQKTDKEGEEEEEEKKFNPKTDLQISEAKLLKKTAKIGDEIKTKLDIPDTYGRMAAQTAKQVIIQRLREAERDMIFNEFKGKENEVIGGVIQRREGRVVLIDLGKAVGVLPSEEQIYNENYQGGERIKVFVKEVRIGSKGPEIILSRTSDEILKKVFYLEIPEISNGLVELKSVAREAGSRSKVAVLATSENIDPIGSCVGQRGARIQTIISELGGEKVDIIEYDEISEKFISNALSPAKIISIDLRENEKEAVVKVESDQLSLAIGKGGQNVRLAARLTGWKIDIVASSPADSAGSEDNKKDKDKDKDDKDGKKKVAKKETKKTETKKKSDKKEDKKEKKSDKKDDKKTVKKEDKDKKEKKSEKKETKK